MAFLEDPRLRQRWNQITHDAEAVTENAAAGIWTFQHHYINPCLGSIRGAIEQCTTVCLGDPEERIRRQRERARERAEYSFNFYDDWDREEESGGLLGNWGGEDWDRLLAGSGSQRRPETVDQPRRKRGMSYGTRGARRKNSEQDPTIIPSTQPIGFLSKLPWKMGGTLRYKPSAADLQEHPGARKHEYTESQPLLGAEDDSDHEGLLQPSRSRKRSGTTGSGGTSDSYRSRGDLFPSDGEGDEDAVALDGEVTYDMIRKDDRSSGRSGRTPSSKGKRPAHTVSRTVSRTTLGSVASRDSLGLAIFGQVSQDPTQDAQFLPSLKDLELEEERLGREEDEELAKKKEAAAQLALERGLQTEAEPKPADVMADEEYQAEEPHEIHLDDDEDSDEEAHHDSGLSGRDLEIRVKDKASPPVRQSVFVPARLPHFG
ncbi:uncharacterized protein TRIVIDRAFT_47969 [Trichoderma virens Gv29-8]|uniref:Uncharacterized protein n=1 Tax=Hypocrea virens (strain Gv29-8 / FGSC 10586) TaxID=413071 RepID=G9MZL3_HYPVG|nr:uncharacterized protein TRIVIDRAFT_47969 [Trichoderma virens Gv29-8]EHK20069.1 hypothetical protein TRIVIDRAFT_47969 [Trichoderma virens Gv29-8]UKZ45986.1 hypothetical protein TrVGV298_000182 [Trichoderma virens]